MPLPDTPRFLVADDHPLYLEAVRLRLQRLFPTAEIVERTTLADLAPLGDEAPPAFDLILVDLRMPGMTGAAMIGDIVRRFPGVPVAVMSGAATDQDIHQALSAGARGFLPKTMSADAFAAAVNVLTAGGTYLPADVFERAAQHPGEPAPTIDPAEVERARAMVATLTPRERQVLQLLTSGLSNKQIGNELNLAEITVKLHVRQILKKTGVRNRSAAAATAIRAGLA